MKAITIRQPWARCVAAGVKTIENRGRNTDYRGPVAIHAAKTADIDADEDPRVLKLFGADPRLGVPVGAVIAAAELVDCHKAADLGRPAKTCCEPWGERWYASAAGVGTAFHLVLADIQRVHRPVYCRGQVMVPWALPDDVAALVEAQLAEGAVR